LGSIFIHGFNHINMETKRTREKKKNFCFIHLNRPIQKRKINKITVQCFPFKYLKYLVNIYWNWKKKTFCQFASFLKLWKEIKCCVYNLLWIWELDLWWGSSKYSKSSSSTFLKHWSTISSLTNSNFDGSH